MTKLTHSLIPVLKDDPAEASIVSHKLMLRTGMVKQVASGIYSWLPIGLKVLQKVAQIVREEMNNIGAQEILMPCIQPVELWEQSGRYGLADDLNNEMLKMQDRHQHRLVFTPTAEELVTSLLKQCIQSYKSLPQTVYQIGWKFRDEIRPRFGVMRGREFLMKDAYSFSIGKESALATYEAMLLAYLKAYRRMGLTAIPVAASTGAMGGDYSHEFHILANTGESQIYCQQGLQNYLSTGDITLAGINQFYAAEEEKHDAAKCPCPADQLETKRGIEVGHIFYLGTKYSKSMGLQVQAQDGSLVYPDMGCYGIGVSRLVGGIIEACHDDKGIVWPKSIAPFEVALINVRVGDPRCDSAATNLYNQLKAKGIDVLYDDTSDSAGAKFAKMDVLGLPLQVVIGPKGLESGMVELKTRATGETKNIDINTAEELVYDLTKAR
ncbi:MAG: proline--tRNA ligase [Proteobacteria bacterium]|nr:proline--tRNA ligase [Pseudomonadota bacterium]